MSLVQIMHERIDRLIEGDDPTQPTYEMIQFYKERTNKHIARVANNLKIMADALPDLKDELLKRAKVHDADKLSKELYIPYVWITWMYHMKDLGKSFQYPEGVEEMTRDATKKHVLADDHHVEYWAGEAPISKDRDKADKPIDASKMPDEAVVEMVCDWVAMSEEKKTNTAREWFMKQKDVRWKFTSHQEDLIDRVLLVLEG